MTKAFGQNNPEIVHWAEETFRPEDPLLTSARENAITRGLPQIQLGAFDCRHLEILVRLLGAKKAVEIGTLGGYSGLSIARAMGAGGRLHTFELDPHHADVAETTFKNARQSGAILTDVIVHTGPALENLPRIANEAPFDLVFIDADKANYPRYLAWAIDHLRIGGAVVGDNTFGWGEIHKTFGVKPDRAQAVAGLREFNHILATSPRFRSTILPTAEGMTVAVKIS